MFCKTKTITEKDLRTGVLKIRADGVFEPLVKIAPLIIATPEGGISVPAGQVASYTLAVGGEGDFVCDRISWVCDVPEDIVIQITDNATSRPLGALGKINLLSLADFTAYSSAKINGIFELSEPHKFARNGSILIELKNLNTTNARVVWLSFIGVRLISSIK
jgi:hypothetical protein